MDENTEETNSTVFSLDVRVVTDVLYGSGSAPCTTNDGCAPTCVSSCASKV